MKFDVDAIRVTPFSSSELYELQWHRKCTLLTKYIEACSIFSISRPVCVKFFI